jgi:hypothetical protein
VATANEEQWWTTQQLLDLAWSKDFTEQECGARKLETWRSEGLLPKPQRQGQDGLRPRWISPPGTDHQLLRLLELRRRGLQTFLIAPHSGAFPPG